MALPHQRWLAWREGYALVLMVYRDTQAWPSSERFGLTAQVRRAAVSVPANLAEGSARRGPRELRRFSDIALGSIAELHCLMLIARDLGYLPKEAYEELEAQRDKTGKLVYGLSRAMRQHLDANESRT